MPGENDDLNLDLETPNEGLEAEANAEGTDGDEVLEGADAEGAAEGDGSEPEVGQEVEGEPQRRQPSRGEQRFQTLSRETKEAKERASNAERDLREMRERLARLERPAPQQAPQQAPGKSQEELALMTSDEIVQYRLGEATKGFERTLGAMQWNTMESNDKIAFQALSARNPVAARFADKVEAKLAEIRSQGSNAPRENVFKFLVGEEVVAKAGAAKPKAAAAGQRRIAQQTVRAGGQRSDTPSNRGRVSDAEAREKRLENLTF